MNFDKVIEVQNCFSEVEKYIKVKSSLSMNNDEKNILIALLHYIIHFLIIFNFLIFFCSYRYLLFIINFSKKSFLFFFHSR